MVEQLVKVAVVVVDVAIIRRVVTIFVQNSKSYTAIYAHCIDGHVALVPCLLLYDTEDTVAKILRTDAHHV